MSHTKEQESIVVRVLSRLPTAFYDILSVSKSDDSAAIKKSYRKLAVKLHPDKNPHPRAAEAFKVVNKAWEVLGDEQKKRVFDQTGQDPTSRASAASGQPFASGFRREGAGNTAFEEELFNMFFGGGGRGGNAGFTFGNQQGFSFQSFGNDFFQQQNQAQRRRQQQQQQRQQQDAPQLLGGLARQLLPLIFVILIPLLSNLFTSNLPPEYLFDRSPAYSVARKSPYYEIPYYVTREHMEKHAKRKDKYYRTLGSQVEREFIREKRLECHYEQSERQRLIDEATGWFHNDERKLERARKMPLKSCLTLQKMNLL